MPFQFNGSACSRSSLLILSAWAPWVQCSSNTPFVTFVVILIFHVDYCFLFSQFFRKRNIRATSQWSVRHGINVQFATSLNFQLLPVIIKLAIDSNILSTALLYSSLAFVASRLTLVLETNGASVVIISPVYITVRSISHVKTKLTLVLLFFSNTSTIWGLFLSKNVFASIPSRPSIVYCHRLNGSLSPVLTATCLSYGRLCDFLTFFPQPT